MPTQKAPSSTASDYRDEEDNPLDDLRTASVFASLSKLYLSETYSDMKIVCGGETFPTHRAVVCPQSPFFDRALSGGFQETASRVVELSSDDPGILRLFLRFLYTGNYQDGIGPCADRPAVQALMGPGEVSEQLENAPGMPVEQSDPEVAGETGEKDADNEFEDPDTDVEPEEEYNQFGEDEDAGPSTEAPVSDAAGKDGNDGGSPTNRLPDFLPADVQDYLSKGRGLLTHARVYIMAHIYDVPSLRLLARDRFYRAAEPCYLTDGAFIEAVDEVYSKTPETDVAMREIMCRLTAIGVTDEPDFRERIEPLMRRHGDFAVGVLKYVLNLSRTLW